MNLSNGMQSWWTVLLRGIAAIVFGIIAVTWPGATLLVLIIAFGVWALVDGIVSIVVGVAARKEVEHWWVALLGGIGGVILGVMTLTWPGLTAAVLLIFIAAWALVQGAFQVVAGIQYRKEITHSWLTAVIGVLSIIVGVVLLAAPISGALAIVWLLGVLAIVYGVLLAILSFMVRSANKELGALSGGGDMGGAAPA